MMDLEKNIDLILELWKCSHDGEHAKVNPLGMTFCEYKKGELCDYQYKNNGDSKHYCARWHK